MLDRPSRRRRGRTRDNPFVPFTPHDAAAHTLSRAEGLLDAASGSRLPAGVADDLRRLAVVMAVAAIDTYMHRLIVSRAYEHDELPGKLAGLNIPFEQALALADQRRSPEGQERPAARTAEAAAPRPAGPQYLPAFGRCGDGSRYGREVREVARHC